jgi:integrase
VRQPLKTDAAERTIEIPRQLAAMLLEHRVRSKHTAPGAFVFASRSGRALSQRNTTRALRRAQTKARDPLTGEPTFPALQDGAKVDRNTVPSFHGFRHSAASEAIAAGESLSEVSWQLGHANSTIAAGIYVQEIKSAERSERRRSQMEERYGALLEGPPGQPDPSEGDVVELAERRAR